MKSNWVPFPPANASQIKEGDLARKIRELIDWYDDHATRKEDDYIKAKLKLVIDLAANIESSDDLLFIEEIVNTLLEIIKMQRNVIQELEGENEFSSLTAASQHNYVSSFVAPTEGFTNDDRIKAEFTAYMKKKWKSPFTTNDYILRVQNLWRSFYDDFEKGNLPDELAESVLKEELHPNSPLLNAYNYIEALNCYVSMKIAGDNTNRNYHNIRAALNMFGEAMHGDEYEKVKAVREAAPGKDFSKYVFDGKTYSKRRLVLAVVTKYVEEFKPSTFDELKDAFPDALQGSFGVVRRIDDVSDKYKGIGGGKRYFVNESEIIPLPSCEQVIVCTQWGASNTEKFVEYAVDKLECVIEKM